MADLVAPGYEDGRSAALSDCGRWRWRLDRPIGDSPVVAAVFGINPSTADALRDDPTVRKWRGFGLRLGWGRVIVGNVFAWRAANVRELARAADLFGPDYERHLDDIIRDADILVPCWGARGKIPRALRPELDRMKARLAASGKPMHCWGMTGSGDPCHPLTLGYVTPLVPYA